MKVDSTLILDKYENFVLFFFLYPTKPRVTISQDEPNAMAFAHFAGLRL